MLYNFEKIKNWKEDLNSRLMNLQSNIDMRQLKLIIKGNTLSNMTSETDFTLKNE